MINSMSMNKKSILVLCLSALMLLTVPAFGELAGQVSYERVYHLGVGVRGEIHSVPVHKGQRVQKGTMLLSLDNAHLEAAVKAAQSALEAANARLEHANRAFDRDLELYDEGSLSLSELEDSENHKKHLLSVSLLRSAVLAEGMHKLKSSRILAPEDGYVLDRFAYKGERVNPDADFAPQVLFGAGKKVLEIHLEQAGAAIPKKGETIRFTDMLGNAQSATIEQIEVRVIGGVVRLYVSNPEQLPEHGVGVFLSEF